MSGGTSGSLPRFVQLDGLRGIAALVVMVYHARHVFGIGAPFARGYLFVDLFFLLSGFVLTLAMESPRAAPFRPGRFLNRRVGRLWPTVAAGAVLGGLVTWLLQGPDGLAPALLLALVMVPLVWAGPVEIFPLNGPQWSILFEVLANIAHALVLRRLSSGALVLVAFAAALLLAGATVANGSNTLGPLATNWFAGLPRVAFSYTVGILLARLWAADRARVTLAWGVPMALLASVPLVLWLLGDALGHAAGDLAAVLFVMPLLFWLTACNAPPPWAVPGLRALGTLSFPLYAVHLPVLRLVGALDQSVPAAGLALVASVALALVLARVLDATAADRARGVPRPSPLEAPLVTDA